MYSQIKKTKICCENNKTWRINFILIQEKLSHNEVSSSLKYHQIQSSIPRPSKKSKLPCYGPYPISNFKGVQSLKLIIA